MVKSDNYYLEKILKQLTVLNSSEEENIDVIKEYIGGDDGE